MTIIMDDSKIQTLAQLQEVLKSLRGLKFKGKSRKDKYAWIVSILKRFDYFTLGKKAKGSVKRYVQQMDGFSRAQLTRLICRQLLTGTLNPKRIKRNCFPATYTHADRQLLAQTDNAHQRLSGPATRRILERQYEVHHDRSEERRVGKEGRS